MSTPEILYPTPSYSAPPFRPRPFIQIVEQPSKSLRYRYRCEGRPGTIVGVSSTPENKVPFAIQILGYQGRVQVVVSCVTKDPPYKPHPHNLVGLNCRKGVCSFEAEVTPENSVIPFPKMAVQCVKKNNVREALGVREEKNIDPFLTGFDHKENVRSIDLNVVRLCFQVFLKNDIRSQKVLAPVVSDPINNKKTLPDPVIYRLSRCNSYANGGEEDIILLCTKITKDDVKIRFFEMEYGQVIWEDFGTFHPNHIYNNSSICFKPPKYQNLNITKPVKVLVQLVRPSDDVVSPPIEFEYLPLESAPAVMKEKRQKFHTNSPLFDQLLQDVARGTSQKKYFRFDRSSIEATNNFLMDTTPWTMQQSQEVFANLPLVINDIYNEEPSTSRQTSTHEDCTSWNITCDDFSVGTNINLDSANEIRQVLNINQIELRPIHISSGDLEMADVDRLSGSLQESLVM